MTPTEYYASLGLSANAEIQIIGNRLIGIVPNQPKWLTAIVSLGVAGELDGPDALRVIRDKLLDMSDWTQINDVNISQENKQLWAIYRQQLRDLPQNYNGEGQIPWPIIPV